MMMSSGHRKMKRNLCDNLYKPEQNFCNKASGFELRLIAVVKVWVIQLSVVTFKEGI